MAASPVLVLEVTNHIATFISWAISTPLLDLVIETTLFASAALVSPLASSGLRNPLGLAPPIRHAHSHRLRGLGDHLLLVLIEVASE